MTYPTIKQEDFWHTNNTKVMIYTSIQQLKKAVKGKAIERFINHLAKTEQLGQKKDPITSYLLADKQGVQTIYVCFCDKKPGINAYRDIAATLARDARKKQQFKIDVTFIDTPNASLIQQVCEGFYLGDYTYQGYQSTPQSKSKKIFNLSFYVPNEKAIKKAITIGLSVANAQNMARDLANTPANYLTPKDFVTTIKKHVAKTAISVKIYDKKDAKKQRMGAFLAVAQGSIEDPYLLELTLNKSKEPPIILVGKGVTFDTGGISIKPSRSMACMKGDMGGAAAVCAAMIGLAKISTKKHVKAIIPLVENMPSAMAYKPGDVITAMNKKTIEVINTDAEGRLILADALCLATTYKPRLIIDIATLTGACSVALGDVANAILGNSQKEIDAIVKRQDQIGERLWQLPLYDDYLEYLQSEVADLTNCAENRLAGTSTAAMFLKQFVEDYKWVHIDIASTMDNKRTKGIQVKGMNGSGTRTLIQAVLETI